MSRELDLLTTEGSFKCKVSSVLNRAAEFQAKHMFEDGDSCWNSGGKEAGSDADESQWILLDFTGKSVNVNQVSIMFQGGFVGTVGIIECGIAKDSLREACILEHIHAIEDSNNLQVWDLPAGVADGVRFIKIRFPASTDFYGRVTIYRLEVRGRQLS